MSAGRALSAEPLTKSDPGGDGEFDGEFCSVPPLRHHLETSVEDLQAADSDARIAVLAVAPSGGTFFDFRRVSGTKQPRSIVVTRNLFTFAALQLCAAVSEGQKIKQRPSCKGSFAIGPNTGRRLDAVYYSARCRMAVHRAKG